MLAKNIVHFGNCLELMSEIDDKMIGMVLADLPYGTTKNKWDSVIDLDKLWPLYKRVTKKNAAIILFGQDKFSAKVILSNERMHRYNLIWEKTSATGYLNAKKMPLRSHEDILIFYDKLPIYNPQKTTGHVRKISTAVHKRNSKKTSNYGEHGLTNYDSTERYPKSVLHFPSDKQKISIHPTQKPVALFEWLIKTYSNNGDLILDNCSGSGTTAIAALNTGREFIWIDNDELSVNASRERIRQHITL